MMKIAVCVKQVPSRDWPLHPSEDPTWIRDEDATFEMNEPDAYALEEALRLRETCGGEVVVCAAGPARVTAVLRDALARGADRAIHIDTPRLAHADAAVVAEAIASVVKDEHFDLILTGLQSDDQGFAQTGLIVAEHLALSHATIVMEVDAQHAVQGREGYIRVKRELEAGWFQWLSLPLPALLTIQSGINQLRYATLKGIMAAKKKEIRRAPVDLRSMPTQRILSLRVPQKGKDTHVFGGSASEAAAALVGALRTDARVVA